MLVLVRVSTVATAVDPTPSPCCSSFPSSPTVSTCSRHVRLQALELTKNPAHQTLGIPTNKSTQLDSCNKLHPASIAEQSTERGAKDVTQDKDRDCDREFVNCASVQSVPYNFWIDTVSLLLSRKHRFRL